MQRLTRLIALIALASLLSAPCFANSSVVTDETLHRLLGDSPETQKLHDIMAAQRLRIRSLQDAFLTGDTETIRHQAEAISTAMQAVAQVYSMSGKPDVDASVWKAMSSIVKEAEGIEQASAKDDYKNAYEHFTALTSNCIACHQLAREWGKFPEPAPEAQAPAPAKRPSASSDPR